MPEAIEPFRLNIWLQNLGRRALGSFRAESPARRFAVCLAAFVLLLGLALRARGMWFHVLPLWNDESTWGFRARQGNISDFQLRPLGFMLVTHWLIRVMGYWEWVVRLLPWCAGVLASLICLPLGRLLFRSDAARLFLVCAVALHPAAIDLAREFKPYSIALFLHLAIVTCALHCISVRSTASLWGTLVFALLGIFFSQDVIFAYPGLYLLLGLQTFRERRFRHFAVVCGGATVTLSVLVLHYVYLWSSQVGADSNAVEYWGGKYSVFFVGQGAWSHFLWWLGAYTDQSAMGALRIERWGLPPAAADCFHWLWVGLHVLGLLQLALRRRFSELALLGLPLCVESIFNTLGFWPLGSFRTCFFTLAYTAPIAAAAFDWKWSSRFGGVLPASTVILLPLVLFEREWHRSKEYYAYSSAAPEVVSALVSMQGDDHEGPELLKLDARLCSPWNYYTKHRPTQRVLWRLLKGRFKTECVSEKGQAAKDAISALGHGEERVWLVLDRPYGSELDRFKRLLHKKHARILAEQNLLDETAHVFLLGSQDY